MKDSSDVSLWRCSGHAQLGGDPREDLGHTEEILSLGWPEKTINAYSKSWQR